MVMDSFSPEFNATADFQNQELDISISTSDITHSELTTINNQCIISIITY